MERWLKESYLTIQQRAVEEGTEIQWGDESGLRSDEYGGRGYALIGHTPEIRPSKRKRERVNYIASLSNQGTVRFMLYTGKSTVEVLRQFLKRLVKSHTDKLFWIGDRYPVYLEHRAQQWLEKHSKQIGMFNLPSYSPELNPVEYLNGSVKQGVHDKSPTRNLNQLR